MMMTCRLLCALLVLALCCCPSVGVRANDEVKQDDPSPPHTLEKPGPEDNSSRLTTHNVPKTGIVKDLGQLDSAVAGDGASGPSATKDGKGFSVQLGSASGTPNPTASSAKPDKTVVKSPEQDTEESNKNQLDNVRTPNTTITTMRPPSPQQPTTLAVPQSKASPAMIAPETGEGLPATNLSQESTQQTKENTRSNNETESGALEQLSGEGETQQQDQDTATLNLVESAATDSSSDSTAPSISTNDNDDAQRKANEDDDTDQRPNPKESNDHKADIINNAPESNETAQQKVTAAQSNETATPGDSDSSTAVSHTTSPLLLLLLVVCAAAVVVAA
ncbi:mucin-associated surface protein (MASP), putative [Trypanosoma cruzi marinkellei]|uniref:Mucin-associated surface protein (MASP), putative n=1 Tax=Trypanosoma cruzi marinkellei TaxID=85056 RepID=K2MQW1_TRYCR|nr:mucin-associated surface protein (MASP), putative [Trypanosoma cruzi marinkellei]